MLLRAALVICILKSFSVISTKNGFAEQSDNNIEPHWNLLSAVEQALQTAEQSVAESLQTLTPPAAAGAADQQ
jgi:hypothetical protein